MSSDISEQLRQRVADACQQKTPLAIAGSGSKAFYGNPVAGESISTLEHSGITDYQPSELVVTVRSGTRLSELEAELKASNQMLAFEPPHHGSDSTIGGIVACGLSGPGRAAFGAVRDFVLGASIINGRAQHLKFGGQVMKNVAGYDASRLMVGAQGTLGILLDISLKVLPIRESEITLQLTADFDTANAHLRRWIKHGLPITASCYLKDTLYIRLGSTHSAVKQALSDINQQFASQQISNNFWLPIKNQNHAFFNDKRAMPSRTLWRCSLQGATETCGDIDEQLIEWNGALRWIYSDDNLQPIAAGFGGHATRYALDATQGSTNIFQPLQPASLKIHQRLKQAFDPEHILNPGRLYSGL